MTALRVSQTAATPTRTARDSKRKASGMQVLASDGLSKQMGDPTSQAHRRDGNDRYKCQENKVQET